MPTNENAAALAGAHGGDSKHCALNRSPLRAANQGPRVR